MTTPPLPPLPDLRTPAELAEFLAGCRNDLEEPARVLVPEIGAALQALAETPGCLLARMSGSGSACFGLYADAGKASAAAALIGSQQAGWWVVPTLANAART